MLMWGLTGPIFGAIADKYGGHKAICLAFIFYIFGIYLLYSGPINGSFSNGFRNPNTDDIGKKLVFQCQLLENIFHYQIEL